MPLIKSASKPAFTANLKAELSAGKPRDQALAIAYATARRAGARYADGGAPGMPWYGRSEARNLVHEGLIHSPVPGRTDKLPMNVAAGSYVLPADHVSGIGQNNTTAGASILNQMFGMGPFGIKPMRPGHGFRMPRLPAMRLPKAGGGVAFDSARPDGKPVPTFPGRAGEHVPIIAAGGEFVVPPDRIVHRFGTLERGHASLDRWVVEHRKKHAKTLRHLKPPKKN